MKKVNIPLDDELHMQLKLVSVLKSTTMHEYIQKALKRALEEDADLIKDIPRVRKDE